MLRNRLPVVKKLPHLLAVAEGVLVALILGSTLVFVRIALTSTSVGPLTITALRYLLAFLLLLPFLARRRAFTRWSSQLWVRFFLIGLSFYVIGNGALFWGLRYISATTGSLLLSLVPLLVLLAGALWLEEVPTRWQVVGVLIGLVGSALFFSSGFKAGEPLGIGIVAVGLVGNAAFGILGRDVARERRVDTLALTAIPFAFGAAILLPLAFLIEGLPGFSIKAWSIILLLAVINTACAYALYNHALKVLEAFEMSVLVSLTPLVTALLAWFLLGEQLGLIQIVGMISVIIGVVLVQWGKTKSRDNFTQRAES